MDTESWVERAERLRLELEREHGFATASKSAAKARETIARWLRDEFAGAPPNDAAQLPLHLDLTGSAR